MSLAPLPDTPYTPRSNCFSIAPDLTHPLKNFKLPSLRVKITPSILVPAQWAPLKGRKPKELEESLEIIAPIGGKIELHLNVEDKGIELIKYTPKRDMTQEQDSAKTTEVTRWEEGRDVIQGVATNILKRLILSVSLVSDTCLLLMKEQVGHGDSQTPTVSSCRRRQ